METPLFSISIICKNEESSLPNLLDSLSEFIKLGGEIVLVDTGSTDNSISILKDYGFSNKKSSPLWYEEVGDKFRIPITPELTNLINDTFISTADYDKFNTLITSSIFDFGSARKYAGSLPKNKWIFSIDCDEVVTHLDIPFLNHVIRSDDVQQLSFIFRYKDSKGNTTSTTQRDKFYNREYGDWRWIVHEQVKPLKDISKTVLITENTISLDHYQHDAEHRSNYFMGMCIDVLRDPNDQHEFWLGRETMFLGMHTSAIKVLEKYLDKYRSAWSGERCMACIYIGDCYINIASQSLVSSKDFEVLGLMWYFRATIIEDNFREPWMKLAEFYEKNNISLKVIQYLKAALVIKKSPNTYLNNANYYGSMPYLKLYNYLINVGEKEEALYYWNIADGLYPTEMEKFLTY